MMYASKMATLVVKDATIDDEAVYMCSVDNRVGRVDSEAKLTVQGKNSSFPTPPLAFSYNFYPI